MVSIHVFVNLLQMPSENNGKPRNICLYPPMKNKKTELLVISIQVFATFTTITQWKQRKNSLYLALHQWNIFIWPMKSHYLPISTDENKKTYLLAVSIHIFATFTTITQWKQRKNSLYLTIHPMKSRGNTNGWWLGGRTRRVSDAACGGVLAASDTLSGWQSLSSSLTGYQTLSELISLIFKFR